MAILVTGGAGYIGGITCELLIQSGYEVVCLDNLSEGNRSSVHQKAVFYRGDIGARSLLKHIFSEHNIDAVFHFAAQANIPVSMRHPGSTFDCNVVQSIALLDALVEHDCKKFIFSSSSSVYGEPEYWPIDEKHSTKPMSAYGESKLILEQILRWYHCSHNLEYVCFRYFNAAGASHERGEMHHPETHLLPLVMHSALDPASRLKVFGSDYPTRDGTCVRDFVHVLDIAQAHILGYERLDENAATSFNLGTGTGYSVLEVIKMIEKVSGKAVNWEFAPRRQGDPSTLIASNSLAEERLGWKPQYDLESIVESAWRWHCSQTDGRTSPPSTKGTDQ
jgi:UDP-glucose 4-epimerase